MKTRWSLFLFFLVTIFSFEGKAKTEENTKTDSKKEVYTVQITGMDSTPNLKEQLAEKSSLITLRHRSPPSLEAFRQRVLNDIPILLSFLESEGYFDARISSLWEKKKENKKNLITLEVDLGIRYHIKNVKIISPHHLPSEVHLLLDEINLYALRKNLPFLNQSIQEAEKKILICLANHGYPFAKVKETKVIANEETHHVDILFFLDVGKQVFFGSFFVDGLESLSQNFILREISWIKGDPFDAHKVDQLRRTLMQTNLFDTVQIILDEKANTQNELSIRIKVKEGKKRFIGAGGRYASSEGFGIKGFWGHRNLFGHGEKNEITIQKSRYKSYLQNEFILPHLWRSHQTFTLMLEAIQEHPEAYKKRGAGGLAKISRSFSTYWTTSLGVSYEISHLEKNGDRKVYKMPSLPVSLGYNTLNDILDPTSGVKILWTVTPFPKVKGAREAFVPISLEHSIHHSLDKFSHNVLSAFLNIGFMPGGHRQTLPADKLFYVGGAGSVRGYGYQMAGPLDVNKKPQGGTSSFETGLEILTKIDSEFAAVAFVETGSVFENSYPNFSQKLYTGGGIGVRYYTTIGPLRLDFAIPFKRRAKIDNAFQIYVGLGQSF